MNRIYLDNNATTPIDPKVLEVLLEALSSGPLNPSSIHSWGQRARAEIASVRRQLADNLHAHPSEVLFHSGATEGLNLAIRALQSKGPRLRVISSEIEHSAVYETLRALDYIDVTYLPVGKSGAPAIEDLRAALEKGAEAIVLSAANSETGALFDIEAAGGLALAFGLPFICDTTALMGKAPVKMLPGISSMHFSPNNFHGPVGIGFSIFSRSYSINAQITGGGQQENRRSGTQSVALIKALGTAVDLAQSTDYEAIKELRDRLEKGILGAVPGSLCNGSGKRLVNTSNLAFPHMEGDALFMALDLAGVAVSLGSACASGALEPSRVLQVMNTEPFASVRFSLSRMTTAEEIDRAIKICAQIASSQIRSSV